MEAASRLKSSRVQGLRAKPTILKRLIYPFENRENSAGRSFFRVKSPVTPNMKNTKERASLGRERPDKKGL
jgi:hypothetical protein